MVESNIKNLYIQKHKYTLILNAETLELYDKHHAKFHPKRKNRSLHWAGKKRIGTLPMLNNFWNVGTSRARSQRKEAVGDYIGYIMNQQQFKDFNIERCVVVVKQYNPTKMRFDLDGVFVKSAFDKFTELNVWEDDCYSCLEPLIFTGGYDKDSPRSEICVYQITEEYNYDFVISIIQSELSDLNKIYGSK